MKKTAKITLKNKEKVIKYDILINIINKKINYSEPDLNKTNVFLDLDNKILIRENKDIYLEYDFKNSKGSIYIKELRNNIDISIDVERYLVNDKKIEIVYLIENDKYQYFIEVED